MGFLVAAERMLTDQQPAKLDFALLTAALAAQRSVGAAVRVRATVNGVPAPQPEEDALVEVILAGPGWRQASSAQQGCFSRAEAGRRINGL